MLVFVSAVHISSLLLRYCSCGLPDCSL